MLSPPSSEPKKIPQQLVFHLQSPDLIVLFLLRCHVSFGRSPAAARKDSCFHFPYPSVIQFDPFLYYVFVFKSKLLCDFLVCFSKCFHLQHFFLLLVHAYIVLSYNSPPVVVISLQQGAFRQCPFPLVLCMALGASSPFKTQYFLSGAVLVLSLQSLGRFNNRAALVMPYPIEQLKKIHFNLHTFFIRRFPAFLFRR